MTASQAPALLGVHHVKLPVRDLARSLEWYGSRLGYEVEIEFVEHDQLMGCAMAHPNGGPWLAIRFDPERAEAVAGFDYFSIGVPGKPEIDDLAARLTAQGESHEGVRRAGIGWVLPGLRDPDGHDIRFYTVEQHTRPDPGTVTVIRDPGEQRG
jgi:catechol 2,3-dioxygenase-like lactoylglutathione lyase family enzyme